MIRSYTDGENIVKAYQLTGNRAEDNFNALLLPLRGILRGWKWKDSSLWIYYESNSKIYISAIANEKNRTWVIVREDKEKCIDGHVFCLNDNQFKKIYKET